MKLSLCKLISPQPTFVRDGTRRVRIMPKTKSSEKRTSLEEVGGAVVIGWNCNGPFWRGCSLRRILRSGEHYARRIRQRGEQCYRWRTLIPRENLLRNGRAACHAYYSYFVVAAFGVSSPRAVAKSIWCSCSSTRMSRICSAMANSPSASHWRTRSR